MKEDVPLPHTRTLGWHCDSHGWEAHMRDGLPKKVGEDQVPHRRDGRDGGKGLFTSREAVASPGLSHVHGLDLPVDQPLHEELHLDSWRPFREEDGFKLRGKELENALAWGPDWEMPCRRAEDKPGEGRTEGGRSHVSLWPYEEELRRSSHWK